MDLFQELQAEYKVYKPNKSDGGAISGSGTCPFPASTDSEVPTTGTFTYITTISGDLEATTPDDSTLNGQDYQGGVYRLTLDIKYKGVVDSDYGIVDNEGNSYIVKGTPQNFNTVLPHVMCILKEGQVKVG